MAANDDVLACLYQARTDPPSRPSTNISMKLSILGTHHRSVG